MAMTDEELSRLVMSIDDNDIEIIPSNGSELGESLDFLPDHFAIRSQVIPPSAIDNPPTMPSPISTAITRSDPQVSEVSESAFSSDLTGSRACLVFARNSKMKRSPSVSMG
jgi:hypothetical protein